MEEPKSRFLRVRCEKCKNEQAVFNKSSTIVHCLVCQEVLVKPTGGKAHVQCTILEVLP